MKPYCKGLLSGLLLGAILFSIPAVAQNVEVLLNEVRINVNGIDEISWDQDISLEQGGTVPASIIYGNTTYLPFRKLGGMVGSVVYWNGDTKTIAMTEKKKEYSDKVLAEKPDSYGNVWTYYTFETIDDKLYLGVKDHNRGYERVYQLAKKTEGDQLVRVTEDAICFVRCIGKQYGSNLFQLYKISFFNDMNSQDGEILMDFTRTSNENNIVFDDDYVYYMVVVTTNGHSRVVYATHIPSKKSAPYITDVWGGMIWGLNVKQSEDDFAVLTYKVGPDDIKGSIYELTFDKNEFCFGEAVEVGIYGDEYFPK